MWFRRKTRQTGHWLAHQAPSSWQLPLQSDGSIRWNAQGIPYVQASNTHDAAVLAGASCYLLRANQIQLFRHVAWGRLAELGGYPLVRVDAMIRSLDMHRAQDDILRQMPEETRNWIDAFCKGLNAVAAVTPRNREARMLGIHHRPFDASDILAIGRLTGTDVNWPLLFDLYPLSLQAQFSKTWERLCRAGGLFSRAPAQEVAEPDFWLLRANRSGSNCMALHGSRTHSGLPLLASDPHLNHQLPNLWLLIGIQCPGLHAVGLMFPGVPVIGLGRNPNLAWGGTNLRAASSDLINLAESEHLHATRKVTTIRVRFWRPLKRILRDTPHGPIVSDHLGWKSSDRSAVAMRWAGHLPSDEITSFLRLMRLRSAHGLRDAMRTYAVTGLNVLAADTDGNIAQTHAAWLPDRRSFPATHFLVTPAEADTHWTRCVGSQDLPFTVNPVQGHVVSTNQDPRAEHLVSWYFNGGERNRRLRHLVECAGQVDITDVRRWQNDVCSPEAQALSRTMLSLLAELCSTQDDQTLLNALSDWDGSYHADSQAALVFESLLTQIRQGLLDADSGMSDWWVVQEWAYICNFLLEDFAALPFERRLRIWRTAVTKTFAALRRHKTWGGVHRLAPRHILGFLPWVGRRWFPGFDFPASGSRETLMKNAHLWQQGQRPQRSTYGAQARQVCDLSSMDTNWFVLLGGQDERVESPHATDQAVLWSGGEYVQMPLSKEQVEAQFERVWVFVKPGVSPE